MVVGVRNQQSRTAAAVSHPPSVPANEKTSFGFQWKSTSSSSAAAT